MTDVLKSQLCKNWMSDRLKGLILLSNPHLYVDCSDMTIVM